VNSSAHSRFDFKKKQFPPLFGKIDKIAYTCNSKDAKHSNWNNFICVQDIVLRELLWQPNSEKYKPKLHKFLFLAKIEEFFACSAGFYGLREFKCAT